MHFSGEGVAWKWDLFLNSLFEWAGHMECSVSLLFTHFRPSKKRRDDKHPYSNLPRTRLRLWEPPSASAAVAHDGLQTDCRLQCGELRARFNCICTDLLHPEATTEFFSIIDPS